MKLLRISASLAAFSAITLLAACGGGGGGGGVNPPSGGGGGPTPAPTTTPTTSPTGSPTTSPGGGTVQSNGTTVVVQDGTSASPLVFGKDNWQTNGVTDPAGGAGDGDLAGGYTSSNTGPIDNVACNLPGEPSSNQYHVHSFLGIFVNGTQYAIPDAIGMLNPSGDGAGATQPYPNEAFSNACTIHTHSTSGIIHIEDTAATQSYTSQPAQYNLQSLLDIWGQNSFSNIAAAAASGFSGPVSIYVGTPCPNNTVGCSSPQKNPKTGDDLVSTYTLETGAPSSILLGHHVAIWVVVGSMPAGGLPAIDFGISN